MDKIVLPKDKKVLKPDSVDIEPASLNVSTIPGQDPISGQMTMSLLIIGIGTDQKVYHYEGKDQTWELQR